MKPRVRIVKGALEPATGDGPASGDITLAEGVHRALRRDIIAGDLQAGQPLRLEYLKDRYGISFSPLREALNRLQTERLVVSTPSRGFRVAPFSEEEMWDVIETRIVIDCEALRRSLVRGDDGWETRMVAAFNALNAASARRRGEPAAGELADGQDKEYDKPNDSECAKGQDCSSGQDRGQDNEEAGRPADTAADARASAAVVADDLEARHRDFHDSLISACGSRWLLTLSAQMYAQSERYRQPTLKRGSHRQPGRDVGAEHRRILDAAVARDAVQAAGLLARHYRETGRLVKQRLQFHVEPAVATARIRRSGA